MFILLSAARFRKFLFSYALTNKRGFSREKPLGTGIKLFEYWVRGFRLLGSR